MKTALIAATASVVLNTVSAHAQDVMRDRSIGFVFTGRSFAVWDSPGGKAECPSGLNDGPREQFKQLYPNGGRFEDTQLEREGEIAFPSTTPETKVFFREVQGNTGIGLNLDNKVGPNDFTSPDGDKGIDNQMYRVIGCTKNYKEKDSPGAGFLVRFSYNRWLMEITDLDDLIDDPAVTVTLYRGLDTIPRDAAGTLIPGGTQRIDNKWGQEFIYRTTGKIENGVLTTAPTDITYPDSTQRAFPFQSVRDWRLKVRVGPDGGEGLMGGYLDIDRWYRALGKQWTTHHRGYGAEPLPSQYRAMVRNADAYPDPVTGQNTHISAAWHVAFVQTFITHSEPFVSAKAVAGAVAKQTDTPTE